MNFISIIGNYSTYLIILLGVVCLVLFVICIFALIEIKKTKKRFDRFMRPNSKTHNIETMLIEYLDEVKAIKKANDRVVVNLESINHKLMNCIQKVGVVRYNTFEDVGGDLSYAVALLDEGNNGVVFNSLYYREGCYSYGKPILNGECTQQLSVEEQDAIDSAIKGGSDRIVTRKKLVLKRHATNKKIAQNKKSINA